MRNMLVTLNAMLRASGAGAPLRQGRGPARQDRPARCRRDRPLRRLRQAGSDPGAGRGARRWPSSWLTAAKSWPRSPEASSSAICAPGPDRAGRRPLDGCAEKAELDALVRDTIAGDPELRAKAALLAGRPGSAPCSRRPARRAAGAGPARPAPIASLVGLAPVADVTTRCAAAGDPRRAQGGRRALHGRAGAQPRASPFAVPTAPWSPRASPKSSPWSPPCASS